MTFKLATSLKDCGLRMQQVKDVCNRIIRELSLSEDDARIQGFVHVRQMCSTIAHIPLVLQYQAENNAESIAGVLLLKKTEDLKGLLEDFNKNSKGAFITTVQFAIENSIKTVLEALGETISDNFYDSAKKILTVSQIPDLDFKRKTLMVPSYMRNSLHRNGFHTKTSISAINIDGATYEFIKGQRVNCGSWSHIFHILLHVLEIYGEIFKSNAVTNIKYIPSL